jgi:hypothetical protein
MWRARLRSSGLLSIGKTIVERNNGLAKEATQKCAREEMKMWAAFTGLVELVEVLPDRQA